MPLKMISILCYRLILHSVKDYRMNELYASQWIELYFEQSLASIEVNIKAENTIAVLISNNRVLLEKQITTKTIDNFISLCREKRKDERVVQLLTALCSCEDQAILSNQNDIINILLEKDENRESLVFPIQMRHDRIEVGIVDAKGDAREWIALKHLKEESGEHDNHRLYKYCCALIELASEMCLERNHRALNFFIDIYPINIVMKAIMHNELDYNVKSKFTKMVETMYVNKEPFDHLQVPHFSRIWTEISLIGNRIEYYKGEIPQYILEIRSFTVEYLKDTKGQQSIFDGERNQMTLQIIKLVKLMVSYGFYRTKEELRELSVTLISLLNGSCDIYNLKNEGLLK